MNTRAGPPSKPHMTETTTPKLNMYYVGESDYVIAASEADAWAVWEAAVGSTKEDSFDAEDIPGLCDLIPDDREIACFVNENGEPDDHGERLKITAREWCAKLGRGMAFSENY
jgi:hypothetical protein